MLIADFHIHSKYARATSRDCVPEILALWARRKGLDIIGTGDFTHPAWRAELREKLVPAEEGLYALPGGAGPRFIISGEISSIYKKNGRVRKVHNVIMLPSLEAAEALSRRLEAIGNLHSDGRPILGLDSRDLLEITLSVCPDAIFIPAHIWTPHFSLFGAYSGFDTIEECFEDLTGHIHALETGLSSDPPMNWRLSALDRFTLVSNSDAHSPANLAREANLLDIGLSYPEISRALSTREGFCGTLEFFPEEGKYHCDGHRSCGVCLTPAEAIAAGGVCPVCGGRVTTGVLHRVEALADRPEGYVPPAAPHFESLVPLPEVLAASAGLTAASVKVRAAAEALTASLGSELFILREAPLEDIAHAAGPLAAEGVRRLRLGKVTIEPGYDGEYGKVHILDAQEIGRITGQVSFFAAGAGPLSGKKKEKAPEARSAEAQKAEDRGGKPLKKPAPQADAPAFPYGLNAEQWEAVRAEDPAVAVVAGPGTGKTKTLVSRIAYLVDRGVPPDKITAVTFTNKAAGEMRARLAAEIGPSAVGAMTIGTFHAICLKMLSSVRAVTVIDEYEALAVVKDVLAGLSLKNAPRDVLAGISLIKSGAKTPEGNPDVPEGVYDRYCERLAQYGMMDYDDILLEALALLEGRAPDAGGYLLADEFQDINMTQYRLIRAWAEGRTVFVIGDPDQAIYGFRGADSTCFTRFMADFPGARRVFLAKNYRSTPGILRCAKAVLPHDGTARVLEPARAEGAGVRLFETEDEYAEAQLVAGEIGRMVGGIDMLAAHDTGAPAGFSDIAVLYRTNRQAGAFEQVFRREGIPYTVAGRDDFLSEPEVRRAVAFFRYLLAPGAAPALLPLLRTWGYSPSAARDAAELYAQSNGTPAELERILDGLPAPESGLLALSAQLPAYAPLIFTQKPQALLEAWIRDNALSGLPCMERLLDIAVLHERMPELLQSLLYGRESDLVRSGGRVYRPDAVTLMTLHGAKGLEFPAVFLCGLTEGTLPFTGRGRCDPDEERRLFYVGMTRARDELLLLTGKAHSSFLADIPAEYLLAEDGGRRRPAAKQFSLFDMK